MIQEEGYGSFGIEIGIDITPYDGRQAVWLHAREPQRFDSDTDSDTDFDLDIPDLNYA